MSTILEIYTDNNHTNLNSPDIYSKGNTKSLISAHDIFRKML